MLNLRGWSSLAVLLVTMVLFYATPTLGAVPETLGDAPAELCVAAIRASEIAYGLPPGLLAAMGEVESGRLRGATGRLEPWPWTVQSGDQSWYFATKPQAVQWVRDARTRGVTSIDTGCLQVNLFYHPNAFDSLDDAFDPRRNVDYAARFLVQLHGRTRDWQQATGFYHSQTSALATSYENRVRRRLSSPMLPWLNASKPSARLIRLASAWQATLALDDPPSSQVENNWSTLLRRSPDASPIRRVRVTAK